jgi:hypothetical protein
MKGTTIICIGDETMDLKHNWEQGSGPQVADKVSTYVAFIRIRFSSHCHEALAAYRHAEVFLSEGLSAGSSGRPSPAPEKQLCDE